MKNLLMASLVLLSGYCCAQDANSRKGNATSVRVKIPEGMKYVPSGSFGMPQTDMTVAGNAETNIRTVQLAGFYMDAEEVSNEQYRQFTEYVRDSIANTILGNYKTLIDGTQQLDMKKIKWSDPKVQDRLAGMYLPAGQTATGARRIDVNRLQYHYSVFDYPAFKARPTEQPANFIHNLDVAIFPDTTVWMNRSDGAFNDPAAAQYFSFKGFNNYPVVGVSLLQCNAFCDWRTVQWKADHPSSVQGVAGDFRLPTEQEWEWAARGGDNAIIPFADPVYREPAGNYFPEKRNKDAGNSYGLTGMPGNVSEWTLSGSGLGEQTSVTRIQPIAGNPNVNRRIVRGGSWRKEPKGNPLGVRYMHRIDSAAADIGFRCVYEVVLPSMNTR